MCGSDALEISSSVKDYCACAMVDGHFSNVIAMDDKNAYTWIHFYEGGWSISPLCWAGKGSQKCLYDSQSTRLINTGGNVYQATNILIYSKTGDIYDSESELFVCLLVNRTRKRLRELYCINK